jgi:hypothetical protein
MKSKRKTPIKKTMPRKSIPNRKTTDPEATEYKHRETLAFKGLTYRYDKPYGEWHRVEKKPPVNAPRTIYSCRNDGWRADGLEAATPLAALEIWLSSLVDLRKREAAEATQHAKDLRAEVRGLKARRWL